MDSLADHELRNWSRWANSGPSDTPRSPGSCLGNICIQDVLTGYADELPPPIHEENAKRVQRIYDVAAQIEKKVLQAEYLWPSKYKRFKGPEAAAAALKIPFSTYESALKNTMRRVERAFS